MERVFGTPQPGVEYRNRPGAYGIAFDGQGRAAVVSCGQYGYFLLGGGIKPGESEAECIQREALEETGYAVTVGEKVCSSEGYITTRQTGEPIHPIQQIYLIELGERVAQPQEDDHILTWVPVEEFCRDTYLEFQAWSMKMAWEIYKRNARQDHENRQEEV